MIVKNTSNLFFIFTKDPTQIATVLLGPPKKSVTHLRRRLLTAAVCTISLSCRCEAITNFVQSHDKQSYTVSSTNKSMPLITVFRLTLTAYIDIVFTRLDWQ